MNEKEYPITLTASEASEILSYCHEKTKNKTITGSFVIQDLMEKLEKLKPEEGF